MSDPTGGLYPFLDEGGASDPAAVLADVRASTLQKASDVGTLRRSMWESQGEELVRAARRLAAAFRSGHKLLAFGNGGSATDAQDLVADLSEPPLRGWRALPALSLVQDPGILLAVANDVSVEAVFSRQIIAYGREGDVACGFSTSGRSPNVLAAFREARQRGLLTVGFAGYDGGAMADHADLDVVIVAPSSHIPRIQEAHATAYHTLVVLVQVLLREKGKS